MDNSVRKNTVCIIGQPACDYVFSSTPNCFIAYGYGNSDIEVQLLEKLLRERSIEPIRASSKLASGQHAFCVKICSKIITSRFCVVFVNSNNVAGEPQPNGNVYMEYGLMLGFNKYVVPFQREDDRLAFNVAGLDTIKYSTQNFEEKAIEAIDEAIKATSTTTPVPSLDVILDTFLMAKGYILSGLRDDGDTTMYEKGKPLGFLLGCHISAPHYLFFGIFTQLPEKLIRWRVEKLLEGIKGMKLLFDLKKKAGNFTDEAYDLAISVLNQTKIMIVVGDEIVKRSLDAWVDESSVNFEVQFVPYLDVFEAVDSLFTPD